MVSVIKDCWVPRYFPLSNIDNTGGGKLKIYRRFPPWRCRNWLSTTLTCPDTSQQNGIVERKNKHLIEISHSLMLDTNILVFHHWRDESSLAYSLA